MDIFIDSLKDSIEYFFGGINLMIKSTKRPKIKFILHCERHKSLGWAKKIVSFSP